ncbi:MAG TPA: amino acid adenylation domain-containing protein, partial [Polyangiaceae bacterium]|nr:amino acid adenylation domain-containing protein [Polyangiaceae bacterium]
TTLAGRPPELAGAERMVGLFINTLPVRARWAPAERLADWLAGLQAQLAELGQHEHAPLYEVGRWAGAPSGAPLFDSLLVFENYPVDEALQASLPGLEITATRSVEADHYPLSLAAVPGPPMRFVLSHDRARVDGGTAEWLLAQFMRLLDRMVERPEALVGDLWALEGDERQRIIVDWNATRAEFPRGACLHDLVAARTREAPDAVAVARGGERWSYARLEARSNALARALGARGVGPGAVVGVCLGRSGELVAAQLALLKAGGAYLPLDPTHPSERLAYLLEDSGARLVITDAQAGAALPSPRAGLDRLRVDEAPGDADAPSELPAPDGGARPDDLAYVIYTSGSTGRPKGVAVTHRNLVNFVSWYARACSLGPSDRVPLLSGLTFDASALELWPALAAGASVHVPDEEARSRPGRLLAWLAEQKASVAFAPTPLAEALLQEPWLEGLALRVLLAGGDALRQRPEAGWRARVVNVYGPTETTIVATTAEVDARAGEAPPPPIGRPIANARAYVLDEALGPVPAGLPGELYVGGEGVARGYSGRPGLTAERFLPDPFAPEPGARMYRTGDRARFLDDGQLEFLGRIDRQVKLRGFRIEPGEIEAALHELEGVAAAAVVLREGRLVGYVVPRPGRALDPGALREALARRLPASMVPSAFVLLDALPLTPHGKIDWRALPPPDAAEARGPEGGEPRGVAEAMLASIWGELLGRERVGRGANFFELGGHSLAAMQLASRVRDAFGVELSVRAAFEAPTLQEMAALVERARRGERVLPPVTASPDRGPAPLSFAQERLWFLDRLSPGNPAYNVPLTLRLRGPLDAGALEAALGALVERHDVLRTVFADEGGRPSQRVVSECALALPLERLEGASDEAIRQAAEAEATRPFDLGRGPLVRAKLLRLADADHVLVLTAHHIVCDAWSLGIVAGELSSTYVALTRGEAPGLPELPVRYADYAAWQRERLGPEALAGEIEWWRARLEGAPSALELPTDRPRPPARALQGGHLRAHLPAEVAGPLRELCRREGVTPFMALLAAFYALLCRQSGQRDLVVGTPVAGRPRPELEPLVGFFLNTLALRVRVGEAASFRELVGRVREATLDALAHQDLPFERLVEALKPPRDPSRSPIFQAMFVYEGPAPALALPGVEATPLDVEPGWAKFDLTLSARDDAGGGLDCSWEYDRALFDAETVERLAAHYGRLLAGALADPDRALGDLPLVTDEERRLLLEAGAGGPRAAWGPLAEALTEQAGRTPDAVALAFGGREISFAELDARSNQIARALRRRGVGPGGLVGVCLPRSLELPLAVWGALKAGGAYVPLDPDYPPARLEQIARDAGLGLVLCAAETAALVAGAEALPLGEGSAAWAEPADPLAPGASAESLAYVLYTSGSTGRPKGVAVRQGAVRNLVAALRSALALPARPLRFSLNGPLAFDTSVKQLFQLLDGHALDVTPDEVRYDADALIGYLERQQVDVFDCTPTHLRALLAAGLGGRARPGLKVLVGGEPVDPAL